MSPATEIAATKLERMQSEPEAEPLSPAEAARARRIMESMPEGRDPTPAERRRSRGWFMLFSVVAIVSLVSILLLVGGNLPSLVAVLLITLGYAFGLLPLIGAAVYRRRDRREALRKARAAGS